MTRPRDSHQGSIAAPPDDLALAFANTRYWRGMEAPTEELHSFEHLLAWCGAHGGFAPELLEAVRDRARRSPALARAWFAGAIEMRETLARIFRAIAEDEAPREGDLDRFGAALSAAPARSRLISRNDGYAWLIATTRPGAAFLLAPVLWSAADLLTGRRLMRVRRCANDRCLWLFLDDSKSGNRKWCMMSACGNRAKAHRHRAKIKEEHGS